MKTAAIIIGVLILVFLLVGAFVGCGKRQWGPGEHFGGPEKRAGYLVERVKKELNLNDDQAGKLEAVKSEVVELAKTMKAEKSEVREEIFKMLEQPQLDQDGVLSIVKKKTQTLNERAPQVVTALAQFYDNLTLEQQAILREKFESFAKHRRHGRHSWGPKPE